MRKIGVAGLLLVLFLAGCTGVQLDSSDKQWKLDDIYTGATGKQVHIGIGKFVADVLKAEGAMEAGIDMAVPGTRLEADVYAEFDYRAGTKVELYEIKPRKWFNNTLKAESAASQLGKYVTALRGQGMWVSYGGHFAAPQPGIAVPDVYTPEAKANCIQVMIETYNAIYPGNIWYWYRWHPQGDFGGKKCKDLNQQEKNAALSYFVWQASDVLNLNWGQNDHATAQRKTAAIAYTDGVADMRQQLVDIEVYDEELGEWVIDQGTTRAQVHNNLMLKYIPSWFYTGQSFRSEPDIPFPGFQEDSSDNGQTYWECTEAACEEG